MVVFKILKTLNCLYKFSNTGLFVRRYFVILCKIYFMKVTLILVCCLLFTSCYTVDRNCSDFKTGTFEFTYIVDGVEKTGRFVRTDSRYIDYFDNKIDSASVRWINNCEFIQKAKNPKSMAEEKAIHFKILTTTEDTYTFEYQLAVKEPYKKPRIEKGTAKKIN